MDNNFIGLKQTQHR